MAVKSSFQSNLSTTWLSKKQRQADRAAITMATDILQQATILAPYDKGGLVGSGRIEKTKDSYKVAFGGKFGGEDIRYAKRRHFENQKNPQTLKYLERAGDNVKKQKSKYFKEI